MRSFIEKQQQYNPTSQTLQTRKYPKKSEPKDKYNISNAELQKMAKQGEINKNNNNIYNGRNLSDNTKVTNFYALKANPTYQSPLLYFGQQNDTSAPRALGSVPETSKVKEIFTNDVPYDNVRKDQTPAVQGKFGVSNLINKPSLNVKYDDAWYLKNNPQHWANLKTIGQIKDLTKEEDDPIMKMNPTLYKVVDANKNIDGNFSDPFHKIMEQQSTWINNSSYIRDMVYRTDLDHPNSQHNTTAQISDSMQVQFPKSVNQAGYDPSKAQMTLNGYYNKDALSLKGGFQAPQNQFVNPVDQRLYNQKENFNQKNSNKLYKPNEELLKEIEQAQKERQYQRNMRKTEGRINQDIVEQQVEEISPSGQKRQLEFVQNSNGQSQSQLEQESVTRSPTKSSAARGQYTSEHRDQVPMNPFNDQEMEMSQSQSQTQGSQPRNMFSVQMGQKSTNQGSLYMDQNCRQDMPDKPDPYQEARNQVYMPDDYVQSSPNQGLTPNGHSALRGGIQDTSVSRTRSHHEQSTLKKKKVRHAQQYQQQAQSDEGESDYGEEGEENDYSDARMQGRGMDMSQEYGDEGEEMDEEDEDFDESHLQQSRQQNQGLEMRLEQIKQNIKSQKNDVNRGSQGGYSPSKEQQSIEHLEDVLQAQRQKLNHLQQSSNIKSTQSKERLDFELSKASPNKASRMRQSSGMKQSGVGMPGSSSVNLEKAYEDLEKEIMEIKQKLQNSISQNDSQSINQSAPRHQSSNFGNFKKSTNLSGSRGKDKGYKSLRQTRNSGKRSAGRSGAESRSPGGGTNTNGQPLDDPDYSLSVSELNSNMGNSLLKSAARQTGGPPGFAMNGYSPSPLRAQDWQEVNDSTQSRRFAQNYM